MGSALEFTDANFQSEVLQSPVPVLVDFWAPWCGPCRMIGPIIEELAKENAGAFKARAVNLLVHTAFPGQGCLIPVAWEWALHSR